jgi:hypothetical protein
MDALLSEGDVMKPTLPASTSDLPVVTTDLEVCHAGNIEAANGSQKRVMQ